MFELPDVSELVARALAEDLGVDCERFLAGYPGAPDILERDVTTASVIGFDARFSGVVVARQECTVAGLPVAAAVFESLSRAAGLLEGAELFPLVAEGSSVAAGTAVAEIDGPSAAVLTAERSALDFLMILSGIATVTRRWVDAAGPGLSVCDTRKTLPGLRALSKYAVRVGGGVNHRAGLHDQILIKDNHLAHADIAEAARRAKRRHPDLVLEIEADSEEQALAAVAAGADIVLLDNMDDATLARVVRACRQAAHERATPLILEASGTITYERLAALRETGVDRVSASALTLAPPVDFGLDETR